MCIYKEYDFVDKSISFFLYLVYLAHKSILLQTTSVFRDIIAYSKLIILRKYLISLHHLKIFLKGHIKPALDSIIYIHYNYQ